MVKVLFGFVSRLLVGAPLSTRVGGVLNATGDLYQCPLTMKSDDCHRVPIDDNCELNKARLMIPQCHITVVIILRCFLDYFEHCERAEVQLSTLID